MGLLLYKSNEMFSATELIRKSKMIFDKILKDEIDKAIILRDGKPGFLLMDFEKYETIMADYEMLKERVNKLELKEYKKSKSKKDKKSKVKQDIEKYKEKKQIIAQIDQNIQEVEDGIAKNEVDIKPIVDPALVVPPRPTIEVEEKFEEDNNTEETQEVLEGSANSSIEEQPIVEENSENEVEEHKEKSFEEELSEAMNAIKSMNFDDNMRKIAEEKIRAKIIKARAERERLLQEQKEHEKDQLKEELELQAQIKEEKRKKEQELKEFWD